MYDILFVAGEGMILPENMKNTTLAEGVENTLLNYIRSRKLTPGCMLPKEQELAEELKVSRQVVREGIAGLKTFGLLEPRKRRGMVLKSPNAFAGVSKLARARLFSEQEYSAFMEIRVFMELGMAEFIFERKNSADLELLRQLAEKGGRYPSPEEEIAFHHKLFSISANPVAEQFLQILNTVFTPKRKAHEMPDPPPGHLEICQALEGDSWLAFYEVIKRHFAPYLNRSSIQH